MGIMSDLSDELFKEAKAAQATKRGVVLHFLFEKPHPGIVKSFFQHHKIPDSFVREGQRLQVYVGKDPHRLVIKEAYWDVKTGAIAYLYWPHADDAASFLMVRKDKKWTRMPDTVLSK